MIGSLNNTLGFENPYFYNANKNSVHKVECTQNPIGIFMTDSDSSGKTFEELFCDTNLNTFIQDANPEEKVILSAETLRKDFEQTKEKQGWLGKSWDWTKNLFGMETGSKHVEKQLKALEEGKISAEEVQKTLNSYKEGQKQVVEIVADIGSATAAAGCYALALGGAVAAPFTGGASLGITAAAIAGASAAGAVTKTAIKGIDAYTGGREYTLKEGLTDALTGAVNGPLAMATAGAGLLVAKMGTKIGIPAAKTMLNSMSSRVVTGFGKSSAVIVAEESAKSAAKTSFLQRLAFNTTHGVTGGAVYGGGSEACNYTINSFVNGNPFSTDEMLKCMRAGAIGGAIMGGAISAGATALSSLPKGNKSARVSENGQIKNNIKSAAKARKNIKSKIEEKMPLPGEFELRRPTPRQIDSAIERYLEQYGSGKGNTMDSLIDYIKKECAQELELLNIKAERALSEVISKNIYDLLIKNPKNKKFLEKWGKDGIQLVIHYFEHGKKSPERIIETFNDANLHHPRVPGNDNLPRLNQRNMRRYSNITEQTVERAKNKFLSTPDDVSGKIIDMNKIPKAGEPITANIGKYRYMRVLTKEGKIKEYFLVPSPDMKSFNTVILQDGRPQTIMHSSSETKAFKYFNNEIDKFKTQ